MELSNSYLIYSLFNSTFCINFFSFYHRYVAAVCFTGLPHRCCIHLSIHLFNTRHNFCTAPYFIISLLLIRLNSCYSKLCFAPLFKVIHWFLKRGNSFLFYNLFSLPNLLFFGTWTFFCTSNPKHFQAIFTELHRA